jgi:NADPH2:quinone reductase
MKAMQIHSFGAEDVFRYDDVPVPVPGPRELLVKISASSVNHSDLFIRQNGNIHIGPQDLPLILGREMSGTVVEVGSDVSEYTIGQRVAAMPAVQTRASGLPGSKEYTGCHAEYALARPQDLRPLPEGIDMLVGAATPLVSLTAWYVLKAACLGQGERVFIQAGSGGVGVLAIQLAKLWGAETVITTAGGAEKCARLRELGADHAIDYLEEDFEAEVLRLTEGRGIDVAVETIGGEALVKSLRLLASGGRLIALGSLSGGARGLPKALPRGQTARRFSITSQLMEDTHAIKALDEIFALIATGRLRLVIARTFPLTEVAAAHRYVAERRAFGKVVVTA